MIDFTVEKRFQKVIQEMLTNFARSKTEQDAALSSLPNTSELTDYSHEVLSEDDESTQGKSLVNDELEGSSQQENVSPEVAEDILIQSDEPNESIETLSYKPQQNGVQDMSQEPSSKDSVVQESSSEKPLSGDSSSNDQEG